MSFYLTRNIAKSLARCTIDNHRMRSAGNVEAMSLRIDCEVVHSSDSADLNGPLYVPCRLSNSWAQSEEAERRHYTDGYSRMFKYSQCMLLCRALYNNKHAHVKPPLRPRHREEFCTK